MFHEAKPRETWRFEGNKISCFPRDQSISDFIYCRIKTLQFPLISLKLALADHATFRSRTDHVHARVILQCYLL